jgi:3-deoxy-manno-octulosonate cytidylyltransferase (CMP-KDO synthetase)
MPQVAIIVPCRLESSRFPRKLLHKIKGRPLLQWVAARIKQEAPEFPLYFAVDHALLRDCVEAQGFKAIMTDAGHQSGTDRIAEANRTVGAEHVINVQADEPLVSAAQIRALADLIAGGCADGDARDAVPDRGGLQQSQPGEGRAGAGDAPGVVFFAFSAALRARPAGCRG